MHEEDDFYEKDEPLDDLLRAFYRDHPGRTRNPAVKQKETIMTEREPLPRYWRPSEMQTWAAPEGGLVHMFPEGIGWKTLSACGQSVMKRDPEEEEYGPLEEWANGSPNRRELCTDCLDLWWNGPAHRRDRMYEDLWTGLMHVNGGALAHLWASNHRTACDSAQSDRAPVPMSQLPNATVCHDCAVIWDTQQARRAGMDDSEGRGWGAAYGDADRVHRFRTVELDATVELTYCTPHRVPRIEGSRATLEEFERLTPACPVCLVATDEAEAEVPEPNTGTEAEVPEERRSPVGVELQTYVHELLAKMLRDGSVSQTGEYRPTDVFRVHVDSYLARFLMRYREEIATELRSVADQCEAIAELVELNGDDGAANRRNAVTYRDAALRVEKWPS